MFSFYFVKFGRSAEQVGSDNFLVAGSYLDFNIHDYVKSVQKLFGIKVIWKFSCIIIVTATNIKQAVLNSTLAAEFDSLDFIENNLFLTNPSGDRNNELFKDLSKLYRTILMYLLISSVKRYFIQKLPN